MSNFRPYDGYEPNEPEYAPANDVHKKTLSPAAALQPGGANRPARGAEESYPQSTAGDIRGSAFSARTWNEEDYLPNEPAPAYAARRAQPEYPAGGGARTENPYVRPTWDEAAYQPEQHIQADADETIPYDGQYSQPYEAQDAQTYTAEEQAESRPVAPANAYSKPANTMTEAEMQLSARFAPPLKFQLPQAAYHEHADTELDPDHVSPTVYQTRRPSARQGAGMGFDPTQRADDYRVEAEGLTRSRGKRKGRALKRFLLVLLILAALGAAAYLNRDWLLTQLRSLLGNEAVETVNQAVSQVIGGEKATLVGYDPATAVTISDKAKRGINAVAGNIGLTPYATTNSNVIARVADDHGTFEYYLFAADDGKLLGYYEGLGEDGFAVCAADVYYVAEAPYLINAQGLPLIDSSRYAQAAGADAVLGPMINGWAVITAANGQSCNFINAQGELLSTLWFAKVYPFTATRSLGYVDTGNTTNLEERFALYELTRTGEMKLWRHTPDMSDVLGCAGGVAVLATGDVVRLDGEHTVLCTSDDVSAYVDCAAVVARDTQTGQYGMFVNGEQQYDFAYDSIAPVATDITWTPHQNGLYRQLTVTGMAYPLPLSHYFALQKGEQKEMVALSTGSVYPLLLNDDK